MPQNGIKSKQVKKIATNCNFEINQTGNPFNENKNGIVINPYHYATYAVALSYTLIPCLMDDSAVFSKRETCA